MDVGGSIEAEVIIAEDSVEVGGQLRTKRGTKAKKIKLGDRSDVSGPIIGETVTIGERAKVEDVYADDVKIEERARAGNLYVKRAHLERRVQVTGELIYQETIDADPDIIFSKPPVKKDELPKPPL